MKPADNLITPAGFHALRARYDHLLGTERPEIVAIVSWAAGNGDRSENGDYIYGRKRMREIDRELAWLAKRMKAARVVDPAQAPDKTRAWPDPGVSENDWLPSFRSPPGLRKSSSGPSTVISTVKDWGEFSSGLGGGAQPGAGNVYRPSAGAGSQGGVGRVPNTGFEARNHEVAALEREYYARSLAQYRQQNWQSSRSYNRPVRSGGRRR